MAVEDYDLYLRLFDLGNFVLIKKLLVYYRFHPGSTSNSGITDEERRKKLFNYRKIRQNIILKNEKNTVIKNNLMTVFFFNILKFFLICKIRIVAFFSDLLNSKYYIYVDNIQK